MYPGSCMIIGMIVDVLMNRAMTENQRKNTGNYWNDSGCANEEGNDRKSEKNHWELFER